VTKMNFIFLAGAPKGGTTTIHRLLGRHNDIHANAKKENGFFGYEYSLGMYHYLNTYATGYKNQKFILDSSTNNMIATFIPERIKILLPNSKIILSIREPAERFISDFYYWKNMKPGRLSGSLLENIISGMYKFDVNCFSNEEKFCSNMDRWGYSYDLRLIERGYYPDYYRIWKSEFDTKVVLFDDIKSDQKSVYESICDFLLIDHDGFSETLQNKGKPKSLNHDTEIEMLRAFYRDSVSMMSELIDIDLIAKWGY